MVLGSDVTVWRLSGFVVFCERNVYTTHRKIFFNAIYVG